ncbi:hypothetical protein C1645_766850 [Glomus cerebriforme]|uniref:Uncharacterized protein n=1 Tax=Glomus cerebriforme TaxID=658196 RepID=A0A397T9V5_9GLOM|nr:hypothetical protein C1645_766850 [Glomus cerebriforme]
MYYWSAKKNFIRKNRINALHFIYLFMIFLQNTDLYKNHANIYRIDKNDLIKDQINLTQYFNGYF